MGGVVFRKIARILALFGAFFVLILGGFWGILEGIFEPQRAQNGTAATEIRLVFLTTDCLERRGRNRNGRDFFNPF